MQMDATLLQWIKMFSFFGAVFFSFMIGRTIEGFLLTGASARQAKSSKPDSGAGLTRGEGREDASGH
jgi:hypothetical protein